MPGYLYFGDALGMASLMHENWRRADAALKSIAREADAALKARLPGGNAGRCGATAGARLVVFNDSVFFFAKEPQAVLHFASVLALQLLLTPVEKGGPIAMRGSVAVSGAPPMVVHKNAVEPCGVSSTRFVADRVSAALVAEKSRVLGPRLLVEDRVLKGRENWPFRLTSKLMAINTMPRAARADTLAVSGDGSAYVDLNWMVVEDEGTLESLSKAIDIMHRATAFSSRAATHAAAARALHKLAIARRNGLSSMLSRLQRGGLRKAGSPPPPHRYTFANWLDSLPELEALLGQSVAIPIDMGNLRELPE